MPTFNLALSLRMVGRSSCVPNPLVFQPIGEVGADIGRAIVAQQPWLVDDIDLITA